MDGSLIKVIMCNCEECLRIPEAFLEPTKMSFPSHHDFPPSNRKAIDWIVHLNDSIYVVCSTVVSLSIAWHSSGLPVSMNGGQVVVEYNAVVLCHCHVQRGTGSRKSLSFYKLNLCLLVMERTGNNFECVCLFLCGAKPRIEYDQTNGVTLEKSKILGEQKLFI